MASSIGILGDLIAGNMQLLPAELEMLSGSNETIQCLIRNLFGATVAAMVYQEIALSENRTLLANRRVICLSTAAAGALVTHLANRLPKREYNKTNLLFFIFLLNQGTNGVLGARSIYKGRYAFGVSALVSTYFALNS